MYSLKEWLTMALAAFFEARSSLSKKALRKFVRFVEWGGALVKTSLEMLMHCGSLVLCICGPRCTIVSYCVRTATALLALEIVSEQPAISFLCY